MALGLRIKLHKVVARTMGVILVALTMMVGSATSETRIKVGERGWVPDYNFTLWSSQQHFYVGDWLLFIFDKRYYNVLEVNKTSYEECNDVGFIQNITRGGRDVVQLQEARPYYFLSSGGYCWHGMKLAIHVQEIPPAPAPQPASHASFTTTANRALLSAIALILSGSLVGFI